MVDARNVLVNLRALSATSIAVDACKLALATVTLVRMQPNRGYVYLVPIAAWSLTAKIMVVIASLAGYGIVLWAAARDTRKPIVAAAAIFMVAIFFRFLFMVEGALVVLQDSAANRTTTAATIGEIAFRGAPDIHGPGVVHLGHDITDAQGTEFTKPQQTVNLMETVPRILQVNIIHICSVAVHVVFLLVIRKYMRCARFKLRPEDMPAEART
ncbi:hypothetical protein IscW_ISCW009246 [Ixodes scapularis]|uniref:Uncharacterized protein n=1 Tax=Ixodes scapularis TaxID=6945 RepID=B7PYW6_IXOSC|nr:hypothetical protein IscW_ISCW009246 [Ixodes scapularis]|eukprot:XP_002404107.1 hypothetical protein IscW_ISCW009246 [Ixodes scapularis]